MPTKDLTLRITGDSSSAERALARAEAAQRRFDLTVMKARREMDSDFAKSAAERDAAVSRGAASLEKAGKAFLTFGAAVGVGLGLAAREAMQWESAWAGVTKTVDGSDEQMAELEAGLRGLTQVLPATHDEIAAVAEAAGALGVQREAILGFTKTMVDLGETTDLTAGDAATAIAQLANVMGTDLATEVDNLGSALVALGNAGASTESQIIGMAQRIAGAGAVIGLTEQEVLGFASALASAGIEVEAGGSSISKVFVEIASTVATGGAELETFAAVAGVSADEFARKFREDPANAVVEFVTGLGQISEAGGNTFAILEELGFSEIRVRDALLRLSGSSDLLVSSIETSNEAWSVNTALVDEANKRYDTTAARLEIARNKISDAGIELGDTFLPLLAQGADLAGAFADGFGALPDEMQRFIGGTGLAAAGASLLAGTLLSVVANARNAGITLQSAGMFLAGPWGLAIGAATLGLTLWAQKHAEAKTQIAQMQAAVEADTGAIGDNTRAYVVQRLEQEGAFEVARELGVSYDDLTEAALGNKDAYKAVMGAAEPLSGAYNKLGKVLPELSGELDEVTAAQRRQMLAMATGPYEDGAIAAYRFSHATEDLADSVVELGPVQQSLVDKFGLTAAEAERAAEEIEGLDEELRNIIDSALGVEEAQDAWQSSIQSLIEQVNAATEAEDKNAASITGNSAAALANRDVMRGLVNDHAAVIQEMVEHGASAEEVTAASDKMQTQLVGVAKQLGINTEETVQYTGAMDDIKAEAITTISQPGMPKALADTQTLHQRLQDIPGQKAVTVRVDIVGEDLSDYLHGGGIYGGGASVQVQAPRSIAPPTPRTAGPASRGAQAGTFSMPAAGYSGGAGWNPAMGMGGGGPEVRVYIGDTELKDIVAVQVDGSNRQTARRIGVRA